MDAPNKKVSISEILDELTRQSDAINLNKNTILQYRLSTEIMHHNYDVINNKVDILQKQVDKLNADIQDTHVEKKISALEVALENTKQNIDDLNIVMMEENRKNTNDGVGENNSLPIDFQKKVVMLDTIMRTINYNNCDVKISISDITITLQNNSQDDTLNINIL